MSSLMIFSFVALLIERVLELLDKLYQYFFSPEKNFQKEISDKVVLYKQRAEQFKEVYRGEIEKVKDHPINDVDLDHLLQVSQGFVSISEEETKDLIHIWNTQQSAQKRHIANKMFVMWILGFLIAFGFCFATGFRLLGPLGVNVLDPALTEEGIPKGLPIWDFILTAILLTSGTKPIHDIFSIFSTKAKVKS